MESGPGLERFRVPRRMSEGLTMFGRFRIMMGQGTEREEMTVIAVSETSTRPGESIRRAGIVAERRVCWTAVAAAIWAPMFVLMIALAQVQISVGPGQSEPWWQKALSRALPPLGWAAPFATTALGLIALGRIHRAAGRMYGLSLALFDALLFPLLLLDWMIFILCRGIGSTAGGPDWMTTVLTSALPTASAVLLDYFLAARAWSALRAARIRRPQ